MSRRGNKRAFVVVVAVVQALVLSGLVSGAALGQAAAPRVYVTAYDQNGNNSVFVLNTDSDTVLAKIPLGSGSLSDIEVSPDGSRVYVSDSVTDTVVVIAGESVVGTIAVGDTPSGIGISPDGSRVYVANGRSGDVSVSDSMTLSVVATIPVGFGLFDIAVTPDGGRA